MPKPAPWYAPRFKTKAALTKAIRDTINPAPLNTPLDPGTTAFLTWVLSHHAEWEEKAGVGVAHLEVRENTHYTYKTTRGIWLVRQDGSEVDISWVSALTPKTPYDNAVAAARGAVADQVRGVVRPERCELCGERIGPCDDVHVDHAIPFSYLFSVFLEENNLRSEDIETVDLGIRTGFASDAVKEAWQQYHATKAILRTVHAECNLRRANPPKTPYEPLALW